MWTAIPRNVERTLLEVSKVHFRKCPNDTEIILMNRSRKPSVLKQLSRFKELAAGIPAKVRQKKLERDL